MNREREAVIAEALSWVGVPYLHATRDRAAGVDCANLIRAAFASVLEVTVAPYAPDWFLHSDRDLLLDAIRPHCVEVASPIPGDIVTFRFGRTASHAGIIVAEDPLMMVHAYRPGRTVQVNECGVGSGFASRLHSCWRLSRWVD